MFWELVRLCLEPCSLCACTHPHTDPTAVCKRHLPDPFQNPILKTLKDNSNIHLLNNHSGKNLDFVFCVTARLCVHIFNDEGFASWSWWVREMHEESSANGFLLVISRLQCKSIMPTSACSAGLVHCCDQSKMKHILSSAIDQYETI